MGLRGQYIGSVNIEYAVNVDSLGAADLCFRTIVDHDLVPPTIVTDTWGRSCIVDSAEMVLDASDQLRPGLLFGKASARPTDPLTRPFAPIIEAWLTGGTGRRPLWQVIGK